MDIPARINIFDLCRPGQKAISNSKKDSLTWKYYILHRKIENIYEQFILKTRGHYKIINNSISFCTTVMDRFEHLEKTFIKNILDNDTCPGYEFILLNYNCPDPRTDKWVNKKLMPYINAGKVNYYKYFDASNIYRASHARNIAFRLAKNSIICNVDSDNYIGEDFVTYISAMFQQENIFIRGPVDGRGAAGRICCNKRDWEAVGGYDEHFTNWGVEDSDFDSRLNLLGLRRKTILPEKFCICIAHSDEMRTRHYSLDKKSGYEKNMALHHKNRMTETINPNGDNFGRGRVQKNFREWIVL